MKHKTLKLTISALMAALTCLMTAIPKIPTPPIGYINLGDCIVLLCGWLLSPVWGFAAAAVGSMLADLFAGFIPYMPVTFLLKGAMALSAYFAFKLLHKKIGKGPARLIGALIAEILMVLGYFLFESALYGAGAAAVNIPLNAVQGAVGMILGTLLAWRLAHIKLFSAL